MADPPPPAADRRAGRLNPIQADIDGTGRPVVLLHGQPGSGADWQWVIPHMRDHFRLLVVDRPGYGRTAGPAGGFADNAAGVVELLDTHGIDSAVLVGHSWAGGVALATAAEHPARVDGLVLVSSVGPAEPTALNDRLLAAPLVGEVVSAFTIGGLGLLVGSRRVRSLAGRHPAARMADALDSLVRLTSGPSPVWRSFVVEQRALLRELPGLAARLGDITVPTAVVHGAADRIVRPQAAENLARAIPGATLDLLAGAGHLLPHDRPADIAAAVARVAAQTDR